MYCIIQSISVLSKTSINECSDLTNIRLRKFSISACSDFPVVINVTQEALASLGIEIIVDFSKLSG